MEKKDIILSTLQEFEEDSLTLEKEEIKEKNNIIKPVEIIEKEKKPRATGIEELQNIMKSVQNVSNSSYEEDIIHQDIKQENNFINNNLQDVQIPVEEIQHVQEPTISDVIENRSSTTLATQVENETRFLSSLRERVLVIFEGLQAPNNRSLDAKVDLIINFLEYQLAIVDERLENFMIV